SFCVSFVLARSRKLQKYSCFFAKWCKPGISAQKACTFAVILPKTAIPAQNNCIFAGIVSKGTRVGSENAMIYKNSDPTAYRSFRKIRLYR
ncbi:hypothetical protein RW092_23150, partial [Paenibacillus sp. 3LSP]|uniref:hypothetical protein n=1 Tax=Paenibacillus sp. 3LSP TaxID=2800795 RepID=UPI0028FD8942